MFLLIRSFVMYIVCDGLLFFVVDVGFTHGFFKPHAPSDLKPCGDGNLAEIGINELPQPLAGKPANNIRSAGTTQS